MPLIVVVVGKNLKSMSTEAAARITTISLNESHKTALVTGSSNGIGEAIVKQLAKLDFKLVVTGRNSEDIERVSNECERLSPSHLKPRKIVANLEFEEDIKRLLDQSLEHFSGRLDLLVNNAGFSSLQEAAAPAEQVYRNFKKTLQVNLNSAVQLSLMARQALEQTARLCCQGRPTSIVQVSSIAALRPLEDYAYCTSKSALAMFSNCMAAEMAPLVRVNCLLPGPIETKIIERSGQSLDAFKSVVERITPLARIGKTAEVADAVLFLADQERASYITGAQLTIDGGSAWARIKMA